jgi:hypothetical protein
VEVGNVAAVSEIHHPTNFNTGAYLTTLSRYIASNDLIMVNNELERMLKEVVAAHLKVIMRDLPAGTVRTIDASASP